MVKNVVSIFLASVLAGCVTSAGTQVKDSTLEKFQNGVTIEADVVKVLGAPMGNITSSTGEHSIWYGAANTHVKGATFIPIVGLFAGGAESKSQAVVFVFATDGKLKEMTNSKSEINSNMMGQSQTR